jgi:hypothetical protein
MPDTNLSVFVFFYQVLIKEEAPGSRKYHFWTEDECIFLVYGVEKLGLGNWSAIVSEFRSRLSHRKANELYVKYQSLKNHKKLEYYENFVKQNKSKISEFFHAKTHHGTVFRRLRYPKAN